MINRIPITRTPLTTFRLVKRLQHSSVASPNTIAVDALDTNKPGHIHAKRPFKYHCVAGKTYLWCTCGWSRTQPFCDTTHGNAQMKISNRPFRFVCTETKDYWFCQCKHTKNRPFCDGTHNTEEIQNGKSTITWKY